jgi:3-ketosteroid 9alpha-monooxygenase subunit A
MKRDAVPPAKLAQCPAFPEGWFQVAYSDDLAPAQIERLHYFGRDLVLFRTESGVAQVLNAYCAHVGAHLGVGGTVVGERIRCPFHAWEYGTDGHCKAIPYSPHIPQAAVIPRWPTQERSGIIFVWHSPVGNPPSWDPPELPEYGASEWGEYIRHRRIIRTTVQEIGENVVDTAHGVYVHGGRMGPEAPKWSFEFEGHKVNADIRKFTPSMGATFTHKVTLHGIGISTNRSVADMPLGRGRKVFWTTNTPIDASTVEVRFSTLAARATVDDPTGELSRHSARATFMEFEKDLPIWENKTYLPTPVLCKGDGPIGRYRLWVQQFYPE